ncbi:MAG: phosphate acyltransferase PlsX [Candidatus Margulisbacteria bacterium]|nr:phosphate acyltransferase PlsX [Candidatus Margulisiibacteriota bacterium]
MRIVVDALGGDYAPAEIVKGAVLASKEMPECQIILVGDTDKVKAELSGYPAQKNIEIIHAPENINMDEHPLQAIRQKKNASINVGLKIVKDKQADGFISACNTGAVMAAALLTLGRVKGIERPAIASVFPTIKDNAILLDIGANADCRPSHLVQFAQMGSLYAQKVLNKENPKVGLLSIGEEDEKGNELTQATNPLLKKAPVNFIGNIEGKDIFEGMADVVVCDGFVGNVVLKLSEGLMHTVMNEIKNMVKKNILAILGAIFMLPVLKIFKKKFDYEEYGGAPLLGVDGICIITHGRAKAKAIKNAIRAVKLAAEHKFLEAMHQMEILGAKQSAT